MPQSLPPPHAPLKEFRVTLIDSPRLETVTASYYRIEGAFVVFLDQTGDRVFIFNAARVESIETL